jgi:hypothetical protein
MSMLLARKSWYGAGWKGGIGVVIALIDNTRNGKTKTFIHQHFASLSSTTHKGHYYSVKFH